MPRPGHARPRAALTIRPGAPGFTLIETLVVLVVLGLTFGLVTPALLAPTGPDPDNGLESVLDAARRRAVQRAQPLLFIVNTDGVWRLHEGAGTWAPPLEEGRLPSPPPAPLRVRVSALGACLPAADRADGVRLDPVRCRVLAR